MTPISEPNHSITDANLTELEGALRVSLPATYRAFLLTTNGGRCVDITAGDERVSEFFGVAIEFPWSDIVQVRRSVHWLPERYLPVASASSGSIFALDLANLGVVLADAFTSQLRDVSSDFSKFLASLRFAPNCNDCNDEQERCICVDKFNPTLFSSTEDKNRGLMYSIRRLRVNCVHELLRMGADPNVRDSTGDTALHLSVYSDSSVIPEILVDYGARTESVDSRGETPLIVATIGSYVRSAASLIRLGANTRAVDAQSRRLDDICRADEESYAFQFVLPMLLAREKDR